MTLAGQSHLAVAPLGEDTTAQLSSAWPHPGFGGRFLAAERTVSDTGFEAHWRISSLTTQARAQLAAALKQEKAANLERLETFDVTLTQPVNVYSMSERAAKYGGLFIALVIMAAFMVELFKRLRLHPVQYGLVGLSIAVFFLLLLALSEKMAFAWAYAGAAAASVALLGLYFSAVLGGAQRGGALAAYVAVLYAALYGLLASENNALLLGALLVFAMLAALMLGTRHVDWWQLGGGKERGIEPPDFPEQG
jgi:inner membrane protein creD